jgi:hypothetical protein
MRATLFLATLALVTGGPALAQEIEPRAYSNAPLGVNFVILGATYSDGALIFDPSVPLVDARLKTPAALFAYARVFGLWGQCAKVDVLVPYSWLSGSALYKGDSIEREVDGFADPRVRLSVSFLGAPALPLKEFAAYRQDLIVAASLQVSLPVGQYDSTKLVNLGTHRWSYKLEGAVSKAWGPWTLELTAAATLYGDNDDFFGGMTREQDTLYAFQGHGVHNFRSGAWIALDATYYTGGRTTIDGELNDDLQQNWRGGATLALPVNRRNSVKLYASSGVSARTGSDYDLFGIGWQYRWGGGL